jgi:hypothetical protein
LQDCLLLVERCTYRAGFSKDLLHLTKDGAPYGTSAFVAWDGRETQRNGALVLRDNRFEMAPGTGDRPLVSIGACTSVSIEGENHFLAGGHPVALAIDPVDAAGAPAGLANGRVHVARSTKLRGEVHRRGRTLSATEIGELSEPEKTLPGRRE